MPSRKKDGAVYFNSNSFLGEQYLSPEAISAGYSLDSSERPAPGESIAEYIMSIVYYMPYQSSPKLELL